MLVRFCLQALCGRVGGKIRSEYAMVGDVINLAARFMGKAKGRIVCDEVTHDLVSSMRYLSYHAAYCTA